MKLHTQNPRTLMRQQLTQYVHICGYAIRTPCADVHLQTTTLQMDLPTVRSANAMPPLLQRLSERKPESLDYLGVSFGLTPQLLRYVSVPDVRVRLHIIGIVGLEILEQLLEEGGLHPALH